VLGADFLGSLLQDHVMHGLHDVDHANDMIMKLGELIGSCTWRLEIISLPLRCNMACERDISFNQRVQLVANRITQGGESEAATMT
jgi:hypothetical protein